MHYLATLVGREDAPGARPGTPEFEAEVVEYAAFEEREAAAVAGGAALFPSADALHIRRSAGQTLLTDGPYAEFAQVVDGLYLFTARDRAEAAEIASAIPLGDRGRTEVRQVVDLGD
ncbi:YciI family protein [Nocardia sp. NPDC051787]|uniref:YciI family protein n=1 Tax=Nocardia sp. NPDC051787 TaxID=3155415 RepID=UPI00343CBA8C